MVTNASPFQRPQTSMLLTVAKFSEFRVWVGKLLDEVRLLEAADGNRLVHISFSNISTVKKNCQLYLQTSSPFIVKFTHITLDLLMISIYPESILYVESDVLNLMQASCGTILPTKLKVTKNFGTFKRQFDEFPSIWRCIWLNVKPPWSKNWTQPLPIGIVAVISPHKCVIRGIFLANHLPRTDNQTKTTNIHEQIVE